MALVWPGGTPSVSIRYVPLRSPKLARAYARNTLPENPEQLAEFLADPALAAHVYGEAAGDKAHRFHRAYAAAVAKRDPGIGEQVREQLRGPTALQALHHPAAPGAKAYTGAGFTAGEFFRAAWHGARASEARVRLEEIQNSYSTEVPADGGFLVPESVRSDLVYRSLSLGAIRQRARVFPVTTARTGLPVADETSDASSVLGGLTFYWTEEAAAITESTSAFELAVLDTKKMQGLLNTPNELMNDAPAWAVFISEAVPEALSYFEDLAYLTGSGAGEPLGMVSCPASIVTAAQSGQAATSIVWENIVQLAAQMLPTSLNRAVWVASSDTFTQLAVMALSVGTGGGPVWTAENGLTIFGRPVYFYDFMPKLGATGDLMFVDPAYYGIADRMALQVASSPHYKFNMDVTTWRITARLDARPLLSSAITPRNGASNQLSAFTQIAAR
jgi:HK97 family phage major capsid protein